MAFGDYATLKDAFTGANQTPISTNWSNKIVTSNGNMNRTSNQLAAAAAGVCSAWYTGSTPAADFEAYVTIATIPSDANNARIYARLASPGTAGVNGYFAQLSIHNAGNEDTQIWRLDSASGTLLNQSNAVNWGSGDKFGFEVIGSTLTVYRDSGSGWVGVVTTTDTTYSAAGPCGLGMAGTSGRMDDFFMGDIVASTVKPKTLMTLGVG